MNILVPHRWLLDHLKTKATPKQIQTNLSLCGPTVERVHQVKGDSVYDIEVTTNRVDAMSVRGIAREAAAILPEFGINARLKPLNGLTQPKNSKPLGITIKNNPNFCHRILAIKLENVTLGPSPKWLADRLEQVDQRPLNNVIDITNYVMWEIGHPVHAFDYDRLTQKTIIVREAKKGEKLITLDNKTHTLNGGEIIFDDGTGEIIDLPGIMGTSNTVVTDQTKNILLFIESSDPARIRRASMGLAIRSQAAILNEKGVDPELGEVAIERALELYQKITQAKIGSKLVGIYPKKTPPKPVVLPKEKLTTYLGVDIEPHRVERILKTLGFDVKSTKFSYLVTPPTWRANDVTIYQDVIEEVARIYGYHNLKSTLMATSIPDDSPAEDFNFEYQIKQWLAGWGAQEIYTYSMVSETLAKQSGHPLNKHLHLKNPLSDDWVYLRRSLIPSLVNVIKENETKQKNVTIFEMQNVYHPQEKSKGALPNEELHLAVLTNQPYTHLKGLLDALAQKLFITYIKIEPAKPAREFDPKAYGKLTVNQETVGSIGRVENTPYQALTLLVDKLQSVSHSHPKFIPTVTTPPIIEDLTFALPRRTYIGPVIETMKEINSLIEKVELKDVYQPHSARPTSPATHYTFTITYRHEKRPLKATELASVRKKIETVLKRDYQAHLVGNLQ